MRSLYLHLGVDVTVVRSVHLRTNRRRNAPGRRHDGPLWALCGPRINVVVGEGSDSARARTATPIQTRSRAEERRNETDGQHRQPRRRRVEELSANVHTGHISLGVSRDGPPRAPLLPPSLNRRISRLNVSG